MTTRACPADVLEWIAWYPDQLTERQRNAVEAHAAACTGCRDEISVVLGKAEPRLEVPDSHEVFQRILARIESSEAEPDPARETLDPQPGALVPPPVVRPVGPARRQPLAIAAAALLIATAGVIVGLALGDPGEPVFRTAADAPGAIAAEGPTLDVVFAGDAPASRISQALREIGGQVVAGPTALGRYRVTLAPGSDAAAAARQLRTENTDVALFAEPVVP